VEALKHKIEGLKHQNELQQRILDAMAPRLELRDSPTAATQMDEGSRTVSYSVHEFALRQNEILRDQLNKITEKCKIETSARHVLMKNFRTARNATRQWEEQYQLLEARQSKAKRQERETSRSVSDRRKTNSSHTDASPMDLPQFGDLDAALQQDVEYLGLSKLLQLPGDAEQDIQRMRRYQPGGLDLVQEPTSAKKAVSSRVGIQNVTPKPTSSTRASRSRTGPRIDTPSMQPQESATSKKAESAGNEAEQAKSKSTPKLRASRPRAPAVIETPSVQRETRSRPHKAPYLLRQASSLASIAVTQSVEQSEVASIAPEPAFLRPPPKYAIHETLSITAPDDEIEFVSERHLKRHRIKDQSRKSDSRLLIKQEPTSPDVAGRDLPLLRTEANIDLDDVGAIVDTPRKRRRMQQTIYTPSRTGDHDDLRSERSQSEPLIVNNSMELLSTESKISGSRTVEPLREEIADVLTPIDPNIRPITSSRNFDRRTLSKISDRPSYDKVHKFMQLVDEDQDDEDENMQHPSRIHKDMTRLQTMMKIPTSTTNHQPSPKKKLRDKSLESMTLGDFKYNPRIDHNEHPNKSKGARECRPGCTDPRCCGEAMRKMAKAMKFLKLPRVPMPKDPEDNHLSDEQLLVKWHLGNRWSREQIEPMDPSEFDELLLDARTALLAQRYGKHKAEEERRRTPVGFWAMGMPDTQELDHQHKEAAEIERALIKYRWDEARKGDGKWIFIDE
jgi:hypothetical protein